MSLLVKCKPANSFNVVPSIRLMYHDLSIYEDSWA